MDQKVNITSSKQRTYLEAIRDAIMEEMREDDRVFIMGEDLVDAAIFGVTEGLVNEFGRERIKNTPISESAMVGIAVGAALIGMRPIVEIMFSDWITLAMDQIVNSAAKMRYTHGGKASVPIVIRTPHGAGIGFGPWHSQSMAEAWFIHVPGLKVVEPSTPYDAKGLMKASIRDNDPVIYLEHKLLYGVSGPVPEGEYTIPLGQADIKKEGDDITVVAAGSMVQKALSAAKKLEETGTSSEVVDLRTLFPFDKDTIINSIKKTGRVIIAHEGYKIGGVGGEIAATICEEAFHYLDAPIRRISGLFTPVPYSPPLEDYWLSFVSENAIIKAAKEMSV